ncbi:AAA family ATPase [Clostridium tagluense]|uniref:ATP-dependent nuclease n=1 Tax=Clostridium tagluense TaxID=360422 RepID=UPI001CF37849|nr:ATP-binding protein [Clostridium tagluense]MCB2312089.1 AAA family ATPase [Clostridium tagluense]MCB2316726.1 AAA family ATPase [Clostridium tagluense]MCB2321534.1 AAA family ATPase [Clostridium tagluense]MCB2326595.1 AAA family ATPase [Clostridium tagluense]MCB2331318.1 AAA family ATPase [Clostridium tagluense]
MYIKEINIKNFKGIKALKINCNEVFNVIIGQNNSGKSTIFEALLLWKRCYDKCIKQNGKGFYKDNTNKYLLVEELNFLRFIEDKDLFNNIDKREIIVIVDIVEEYEQYSLGFKIERITNPQNAYLRIHYVNFDEFDNFYKFIEVSSRNLIEAIFLYQSKPVSNVFAYEPIMTKGQVTTKINKGKSHEVLRNKIKKNQDLPNLINKINAVLESDYNIKFPNRTNDEYLDLKVISNGKEMDIHLQGSGFLQVAEIFSSIGYFDSALNVLLLDEPDSHIHTKLQKNLLKELKNNENTQTFIISHNDCLVDETENDEIFLLNDEVKKSGILNPLEIENFNLIKKELGGTISAIETLAYCDRIVFVEGEGDIQYIHKMSKVYQMLIGNLQGHKVQFFKLRGKGFLEKKIEFCIRLLTQITRNKKFSVLYDKDFCDLENNEIYETKLRQILGENSNVFCYDGYCIESTLFSDLNSLVKFLTKVTQKDEDEVSEFVNEWFSNLQEQCNQMTNPNSESINRLRGKFKSQKSKDRPELENVEFSKFLVESTFDIPSLRYIMNKENIKIFIDEFEKKFDKFVTEEGFKYKASDYAQRLFEIYIESIQLESDIYACHKSLLEGIYEVGGGL